MQLRQTFSINLPIDLYQELTNKAGKGKISKFIKELLERELKKDKANLAREYQECYTKNSRLLEEAKQ
jgi:predicted CopG family antitoxin